MDIGTRSCSRAIAVAAEVLLLCGAIVNLIWFRIYFSMRPETPPGGVLAWCKLFIKDNIFCSRSLGPTLPIGIRTSYSFVS